MDRIYLDYNATTPPDPDVVEASHSCMEEVYGNPSSTHREGRKARKLVDDARDDVSALLNCEPSEIVFTGSGSESNNMAIKGVAGAFEDKGRHLITTSVEHPSVLKTFRHLESKGWQVTYLDVNGDGLLDPDQFRASIRNDTVMASFMMANNETGVIFPVAELASIARERGVVFHTDAVQAVGKIEVDVKKIGADILSLAGHKFYGPKGVGALYIRSDIKLQPLVHGGGQESGMRAGTENLSAINGLAKAAEISRRLLPEEAARIGRLKTILRDRIIEAVSFAVPVVTHDDCLTNTLSISFPGVSAEALVMALDLEGIALSSGSACSSGAVNPSHVLLSMGMSKKAIEGTLRISLGRWTTVEELEAFVSILSALVGRFLAQD